jgi:hypothetical protein
MALNPIYTDVHQRFAEVGIKPLGGTSEKFAA